MEKARSEAVLLHCQDPRFHFPVLQQVRGMLGVRFDQLDSIGVPGGSKLTGQSGIIRQGLDIAINKHGAKRVVLVHHQDCGAYGGSCAFCSFDDELRSHENDMRRSAHYIKRFFPDVCDIRAFVAVKNGQVSLRSVFQY